MPRTCFLYVTYFLHLNFVFEVIQASRHHTIPYTISLLANFDIYVLVSTLHLSTMYVVCILYIWIYIYIKICISKHVVYGIRYSSTSKFSIKYRYHPILYSYFFMCILSYITVRVVRNVYPVYIRCHTYTQSCVTLEDTSSYVFFSFFEELFFG